MTTKLQQFRAARSGLGDRMQDLRGRRRQLDATQWCTPTRHRTIPERPHGKPGNTLVLLALLATRSLASRGCGSQV
jgi:hypothetical protein